MRLGVVGMLPPDFREISDQHLAAIKALNLTGTAFHAPWGTAICRHLCRVPQGARYHCGRGHGSAPVRHWLCRVPV